MDSEPQHTGVLLINLGTPDSPRPADVRRYLREFLGDPRVMDVTPLLRRLLLYGVILPFRPHRSATAYAKIWTEEGSPLLVHGRALCAAVAAELGSGFHVELAMRYGSPSIAKALARLREAGVRRLVIFPLFPQYSAATTGSALARVYELLARGWDVPAVSSVGPFYDRPEFLASLAAATEPRLAELRPDFVLMSFHGLPERQLRKSDPSASHCLSGADCCNSVGPNNRSCYRAHCIATARGLAAVLGLESGSWGISFQSRLGRTPWIRPYTDEMLEQLAARGTRRLAVLCPAFAADCLETLEEIGIRARQRWQDLGGKDFALLPCPNSHPRWVRAVTELIHHHAPQD